MLSQAIAKELSLASYPNNVGTERYAVMVIFLFYVFFYVFVLRLVFG